MIFQLQVFFITIMGTFLISSLTFLVLKGYWPRFLWLGLILGTFIYNGIGASYLEKPFNYLIYYFVFVIALACSFFFFTSIFTGISRYSGRVLNKALCDIDRQTGWDIVIWAFLFLHFIPLLYPEFRLYDFFNPSLPDLKASFQARFQIQEINSVLKISFYIRVLMTPFFFIALYRHRRQINKIIFVLSILLYVQYVDKGYIGRSNVGMATLLVFISVWTIRPDYRRRLVVIGIALVPLGLAASYFYSLVRVGRSIDDFNFWNAILKIINQETGFPVRVGIPIIESGQRVNLLSYFKWIVTLPIPKILTGEIAGARINYEISEVLFGTSRGEKGWYVVLPGVLAESIYIYGRYFFWLHSVMIGFLGGVLVRLVERTPQLLFLQAHIVILFFYNLNRAGISGMLSDIINHFILFYGLIFFLVFKPLQKKAIRTSLNQTQRVI